MPRRRKRMNGGSTVTQIRTANKNIKLENKLLSAKPPLQQPGQIAMPRQYGGALRDRYGAYLYMPHS